MQPTLEHYDLLLTRLHFSYEAYTAHVHAGASPMSQGPSHHLHRQGTGRQAYAMLQIPMYLGERVYQVLDLHAI